MTIDGTYIHSHQHAAGAKGAVKTDFWPQPRRLYEQSHVSIGALGNPINIILTGGKTPGIITAPELIEDHTGYNIIS